MACCTYLVTTYATLWFAIRYGFSSTSRLNFNKILNPNLAKFQNDEQLKRMLWSNEILRDFNQNSMNNINKLRPRQNGRHFADDTFKRIFLNENVKI